MAQELLHLRRMQEKAFVSATVRCSIFKAFAESSSCEVS